MKPDPNNAECLIQEMFPITAKPKALGEFGYNALHGLIMYHL